MDKNPINYFWIINNFKENLQKKASGWPKMSSKDQVYMDKATRMDHHQCWACSGMANVSATKRTIRQILGIKKGCQESHHLNKSKNWYAVGSIVIGLQKTGVKFCVMETVKHTELCCFWSWKVDLLKMLPKSTVMNKEWYESKKVIQCN